MDKLIKIRTRILLLVNRLVDILVYIIKKYTRSRKKNNFSIITASHNCAIYLDEYFDTILSNKYDINKIEIIFIDDGSTDNTKEIVKQYQQKYPNIIKYIYQKNMGQAKARNLGIGKSKNNWLTFIDADDFINNNYFSEANKAINMTRGKALVSAKYVNYIESEDKIVDSHPLTYRFRGKTNFFIRDLRENANSFQLSMNSVFFPRDNVVKNNLKIPNLKPQFEDAMFVFEYMLKNKNYNIIFSKTMNYYYRRRANNSSTLNNSNYKKEKYVDLLKDGYLKLLKTYYKENRSVYQFVQNAVIYDLSWNVKILEDTKFDLSPNDRQKRTQYLEEISKYIEYKQIVHNWKYLWKMYQIGINYKFYEGKEFIKHGLYLHYETNDYYKYIILFIEDKWQFKLDDKTYNLDDLEHKKFDEQMNEEFFVYKYYIKIPKKYKQFSVTYDNEKVKIPQNEFIKKEFKEDSLCIFFDRENKADDNAEALYEWFMKNKPEYSNMYFAISTTCEDFERLNAKGFKLIDYKSEQFEEYYINADFIISSAFDRRIENYKNWRYHTKGKKKSNSKFIFLQHGIITDDLSRWFSIKRVDKLVISTEFEKKNIREKYTLFDEEVILTGLPRYDKLYNDTQKIILIQFTWRMEYQNYKEEEFIQTEYVKNILKILKDKKLNKEIRKEGYKIHLILHPEVNKYLHIFEEYSSDYVIIKDSNKVIFRDEFAKAALMITDYSSVANDFAYLKKPIIYYQYDLENFFKKHLYQKGMDYEEEGFGKITYKHEELIYEIQKQLKNNCKLEKKYENKTFFKFNDKSNCSRIYNELLKIK